MTADLCQRLRDHAACRDDDHSCASEAADEINTLTARVAELELITVGHACEAGFEAGLNAAADYIERIGAYGSEHSASEIRCLSMPEAKEKP